MNISKPKSDTLTDLTNVAVPVSYSTLTGLAMVLSDSNVSDQKIIPKARVISTSEYISGAYSFAVPTGYAAAPYQLPMMEPQVWNVVEDVITAYQPMALYQIGSKSYVDKQGVTVADDYMDTTFPIIIYPSDYTLNGEAIRSFELNQSVTIRIYKNVGVGINWLGGNVINNGMSDEVIRAATELTFVVTNVGGTYTVTDWVTPDVVLVELGSVKTKAKTSMAAMINEVYDLTLRGQAAGGDLAGTYPNPTIAPNTISTDKIQDGAITAQKLAEKLTPCMIGETKTAYDMSGNIFGDNYLLCDGTTVLASDYPDLKLFPALFRGGGSQYKRQCINDLWLGYGDDLFVSNVKQDIKCCGGVAYNNGIYVIAGFAGHIYTTTNMTVGNYTRIDTGEIQNNQLICLFGSTFITYGNGYLLASVTPNASEWRKVPISFAPTSIAYGNNIGVAVCGNGSIYSSDNVDVWTQRQSSGSGYINVNFINGEFLAITTDGILRKSSNGIEWSEVRTFVNVTGGIYHLLGYYMILHETGVHQSKDMISWSSHTIIGAQGLVTAAGDVTKATFIGPTSDFTTQSNKIQLPDIPYTYIRAK